MKIKFSIDNSEDYFTITKSDNYGYNLTQHIRSKSEDAKNTHRQHTLFYATLGQVAEKVVWLGLDGEGIQQVIDSMVALSERLEGTLEKMVCP